MVLNWSKLGPGDCVPNLDLIAMDSFLASPGMVTLMLSARHPDLVTLVLTCGPLGPGHSVPHLSLTWT